MGALTAISGSPFASGTELSSSPYPAGNEPMDLSVTGTIKQSRGRSTHASSYGKGMFLESRIFLDEFYKKGCQEKSSPSTGKRDSFSRSSPLSVSALDFARGVLLWLICPSCGVHLSVVTTPIESRNRASGPGLGMSTMVLSEARGLSLFLVIRGGIT